MPAQILAAFADAEILRRPGARAAYPGYAAVMAGLKPGSDEVPPSPAPGVIPGGSRWRSFARSIFWTVMVIIAGVVTLGVIVAGVYPRVSTFLECGSISGCYH